MQPHEDPYGVGFDMPQLTGVAPEAKRTFNVSGTRGVASGTQRVEVMGGSLGGQQQQEQASRAQQTATHMAVHAQACAFTPMASSGPMGSSGPMLSPFACCTPIHQYNMARASQGTAPQHQAQCSCQPNCQLGGRFSSASSTISCAAPGGVGCSGIGSPSCGCHAAVSNRSCVPAVPARQAVGCGAFASMSNSFAAACPSPQMHMPSVPAVPLDQARGSPDNTYNASPRQPYHGYNNSPVSHPPWQTAAGLAAQNVGAGASRSPPAGMLPPQPVHHRNDWRDDPDDWRDDVAGRSSWDDWTGWQDAQARDNNGGGSVAAAAGYTPPYARAQSSPVQHSLSQSDAETTGPIAYRSCEAVWNAASAACASNIRQAGEMGIPLGPIVGDSDDLKEAVARATRDPNTMGGGFGVRIDKTRKPGSSMSSGTRCEIVCSHHVKKKRGGPPSSCDCPWKLFYEFATEGWVLYECCLEHRDHTLEQTRAAVMAKGSGRSIPKECLEIGDTMNAAGIDAKTIYRFYLEWCKRKGLEANFERSDVYDAHQRKKPQERAKDATELLTRLAARKEAEGLEYFWENDDEGRIDRIFVECKGAKDTWRCDEKDVEMVLVFDPTFGTNRYGMKLSMFVTVGSEGETVVLAWVLHHEESFDDVYWALRSFNKVFSKPPATFLTDSAIGILQAAKQMTQGGMAWEGCQHLLCIYHIDQNFYEHVHPLFATRKEEWNKVHDMFWHIAKSSDVVEQDRLDENLAAMRQYIDEHGRGDTKAKVLKWFDDILAGRVEKWAACHTWRFFTAGSHASSRGESLNAAIKAWLRKNSSLVDLLVRMDDYVQFKQFKDECWLQKRMQAETNRQLGSTPTFIREVKDKVTQYAMDLVMRQLVQVHQYQVARFPDDDPYGRCDAEQDDPQGTNYCVWRNDTTAVDEYTWLGPTQLERDDRGHVKSHECMSDFGIGDTHKMRWTTCNECSCHFVVSYGVPCRHIISVRLFFLAVPPPEGVSILPFHQLFARCWRAATDVAPRHVSSMATAAPSARAPPTPAPQVQLTASLVDLRAKMKTFGFAPLVLQMTSSFNIKDHIGGYVMRKYGNRKQGGWHVAEMRPFDEPDAVELYFRFSDPERPANWIADPAFCVQDASNSNLDHRMGSWFLLKELEPGQGNGTAPRNPAELAPGRRREKRHRPAAGGPLAH